MLCARPVFQSSGEYPYNLKGGVTIFNDRPYTGLWTCTGFNLQQ